MKLPVPVAISAIVLLLASAIVLLLLPRGCNSPWHPQVIASVAVGPPNGGYMTPTPNELLDSVENAGIRQGSLFAPQAAVQTKQALKSLYAEKYKGVVRDVAIEITADPVAVDKVNERLSFGNKEARLDAEYVDVVVTVTESRMDKKRGFVRLPEPNQPERRPLQEKFKGIVTELANRAYDPGNEKVYGDQGLYAIRTPGLRPPDEADEILKALYFYDLLSISDRADSTGAEVAKKVDLLAAAVSTEASARQRIEAVDNKNYYFGYTKWYDLLIFHRHALVDSGYQQASLAQLKESMDHLLALQPTSDSLGNYRLDGSTVTAAFYATLSLEVDAARNAADPTPLRQLLTQTGFTSKSLKKLTGWVKGNYHNANMSGEGMLAAEFKYLGTSGETPHLVGGKLLFYLAEAFLNIEDDTPDMQKARENLDNFKRVLENMRDQRAWKRNFTYYDLCYVLRAVSLAARYEFEYFDNENQAIQYLEWAQDLADKHDAKTSVDLGVNGDVSHYYFYLAHTSLAREYEWLQERIRLTLDVVPSTSEAEGATDDGKK